MKKVLILTTISGFLQQFEMNDVSLLQKAGYEVHYASNFDNPVYEVDRAELIEKGIRLHPITIQKSPGHIFKNIKALLQIRRIITKEHISIIHCHNPMGGVLGRLAAILSFQKLYILYTVHGFHFYKGAPLLNWLLYYPVEYLLAGCTDCLITINNEDYKRASRFRLRKGGRVKKIPGVGVETRRFTGMQEVRKNVRDSLHIGEDSFFVLSVGELNHNKNHENILRAIAQLGDKQIHYGICGRGYREAYLKELAVKLGIEKQFTLFGFRTDIPEVLQGADCFAFPSKREGLGIAALEAMAGGIPMITSDCRGTKEYMENGVTGQVCAHGFVEEYADALRTMKADEELRRRMSMACIDKAAHFDIRMTDKIMREIYKQLPG